MVTLVGDAGVGKPRLTQEFLASVAARSRIVRGRCLPYGEGITFWPIVEVVAGAAGIHESDPPEAARRKLRQLVGDDAVAESRGDGGRLARGAASRSPSRSGASAGSSRSLAAERPLVVVFDDIHWAEATFLELIGRLTATIESASVLLLCTARRELLEKEPTWAESAGQRRIDLDTALGPRRGAGHRQPARAGLSQEAREGI